MVNTEIRLIIFFAAKDGEAVYSQQKQDQEADCGSNHELLIAKFILECEVKSALESITTNKASRGDGIPVELFQILKNSTL